MTGEAELERPTWLKGSFGVVSFDPASPRTAEVTARAQDLEVVDAAANTRLTIHAENNGFTVKGNVAGGSQLTVIPGQHVKGVKVAAPFDRVHIHKPKWTFGLELRHPTREVQLDAGKWKVEISNPETDRRVDRLIVTEASTPTTLTGNITVQTFESQGSGKCDYDLPHEPDATYRAPHAELHMHTEMQPGADVQAGSLTTHKRLLPGIFECETANLRFGAAGTTEQTCVLRATGKVDIDKDVSYATIDSGSNVQLSGHLKNSTVKAKGKVRIVDGNVQSSNITGRASDGIAIEVGGSQAHPPIETVAREDIQDDEAWKKALPTTPTSSEGKISGGSVSAPDGDISCLELTGTNVQAARNLRASKSITVDKPLNSETVVTSKLHINNGCAESVQVGSIAARGIVASGTLNAETSIVSRSLTAATGDEVEPLTLHAPTIDISGSLKDGPTLHTTEKCDISADENSSYSVRVSSGTCTAHGGSVEHASVHGHTEPEEGQERTELNLKAPVSHLATAGHVTVQLAEDTNIEESELSGNIKLLMTKGKPPGINLTDPNHVTVTLTKSDTSSRSGNAPSKALATLRLTSSSTLTLDQTQSGSLQIDAHWHDSGEGGWWNLGLHAHQHQQRATVTATVESNPENSPTLTLTGPVDTTVTGTYQQLRCHPAHGYPTLSTSDVDTSLHDSTGKVRLGSSFQGIIYGSPENDTSVCIVGADTASESDTSSGGRLIDVDITPLSLSELQHLEQLDVIDPTPWSLRNFGTSDTDAEHRDAKRAELRMMSERANSIVDLLEGRAVSGGSRSAAKWAAARLQHRALPRSRPEWSLRWFHRSVGYGQNPFWAALTLLASYLAVVGARLTCWTVEGATFCTEQVDILADWTWLSAFSNTLLQPVSLIQFVNDSGDGLFHRDIVNLVVFLAIGLPLVFLIIALKNYLTLKDD